MKGRTTTAQRVTRQEERQRELELATRAAEGDELARRRIAESLFDRVRTTVYYLSPGHRDLDDWVQLAMIEILSSLGTFRGESALTAWADRIAIRTAMRHLKRRRHREIKTPLVEELPRLEPEAGAPLDESAERLMARRHLSAMMGQIDENCRGTLVLKLVHDYTVDEIAAMTDTPRDTVKGRLKRGRKALRNKLGKNSWLMRWARTGAS